MKLTISIGTYNRPADIQRQVRRILKQLNGNVQLCVFDNHSDIPVASLFEEDELNKFSIIRNKINIGRDQNQVRSIENVEDGWVWTLSDDDELTEGSIQKVLDTIDKYPECCYINFGNKKFYECNSFDELINYFSIVGTFGNSFFQSNCIYNVDRIKNSLFWFNEFLSSQIGQICMVLKHMELNQSEKCLFLNDIIVHNVKSGGWSKKLFVINSSIIIDKLHYKKNHLKSTLFKGMGDLYFPMLCSCELNLKEFLYFHSLLSNKLGLGNILKYNIIT